MELLRITRQIHCKAVEQRAKLIHRQYNRDWGTSYSRPPIDPYLTSPRYKIWRRHCLLTTIKVNMIVCLMKVIKVAYRNELLLFCLPTCLYIGYSIAQCFTFGPTAAHQPKFGRGRAFSGAHFTASASGRHKPMLRHWDKPVLYCKNLAGNYFNKITKQNRSSLDVAQNCSSITDVRSSRWINILNKRIAERRRTQQHWTLSAHRLEG